MAKPKWQFGRLALWSTIWLVGCAVWWGSGEPAANAASENWTVPDVAPVLTNPGFECGVGFYSGLNPDGKEVLVPNGWTAIFLDGSPDISSTRHFYTGECNPNSTRFIEKLGGIDSFLVRAEDIETPPEPGKRFDVVIYHQVPATYGGGYSLSAWMTSKCGNANPVDCPEGNYIAKAIGIDPYGGTNPNSPNIEWVEDRDNLRWQNLYTSATALTTKITIFARMTSPFQFHGNLGFMDEFSLIRAPVAALQALPAVVRDIGQVDLTWFGEQSFDVDAIVGGNFDLLFDVQARPLPDGSWRTLVEGADAPGSMTFQAPCPNTRYEFRVRARAEQPDDEEGVFPNHRYPGVWSKPQSVRFTSPPAQPITDTIEFSPTLYLPVAVRLSAEGC